MKPLSTAAVALATISIAACSARSVHRPVLVNGALAIDCPTRLTTVWIGEPGERIVRGCGRQLRYRCGTDFKSCRPSSELQVAAPRSEPYSDEWLDQDRYLLERYAQDVLQCQPQAASVDVILGVDLQNQVEDVRWASTEAEGRDQELECIKKALAPVRFPNRFLPARSRTPTTHAGYQKPSEVEQPPHSTASTGTGSTEPSDPWRHMTQIRYAFRYAFHRSVLEPSFRASLNAEPSAPAASTSTAPNPQQNSATSDIAHKPSAASTLGDERAPTSPESSAAVPEQAAQDPDESHIRAALDAASEDILACVARERVAVHLLFSRQRQLKVSLRGDLTGSAEETCVEEIVSDLGLSPFPQDHALIHVVKDSD